MRIVQLDYIGRPKQRRTKGNSVAGECVIAPNVSLTLAHTCKEGHGEGESPRVTLPLLCGGGEGPSRDGSRAPFVGAQAAH